MRFFFTCSFLAILLTTSAPFAAIASSPDETITRFHESLLSTLARQSGQSDKSRYDALGETLDKTFNYHVMIRTVAGRQWRKSDSGTQEKLQRAFRDVSVATYADQYAGLTDGTFETLGTRDGPRDLKFVDTKLTTPSREVLLTYVMRKEDMSWQIIDVLLDGGKISELARKASEYSKTLKEGGAIALTEVLQNQKTQLLAK